MNFHNKNIYELIAIEEYIKCILKTACLRGNLQNNLRDVNEVIEKKSAEMYKAYHPEEDYDYLTEQNKLI